MGKDSLTVSVTSETTVRQSDEKLFPYSVFHYLVLETEDYGDVFMLEEKLNPILDIVEIFKMVNKKSTCTINKIVFKLVPIAKNFVL